MTSASFFLKIFSVATIAALVLVACQPLPPDTSFPTGNNQVDSDEMASDFQTATESSEVISERYVEYSPTAYAAASDRRRVLFFYANWCPTCRPADANLLQNIDKIPEDVTILRVNYDDSDTDQDEQDLATKYNVTYQHTFVQIDDKDNLVGVWNGGQLNELLSNLK